MFALKATHALSAYWISISQSNFPGALNVRRYIHKEATSLI